MDEVIEKMRSYFRLPSAEVLALRELEEAKLRRMPAPKRLTSSISAAIRYGIAAGTHMISPASCWSVAGSMGITWRAST